MGLDIDKIDWVKRLKEKGWSIEFIALKTRLPIKIVERILSGYFDSRENQSL